jgi:hypothetical protein
MPSSTTPKEITPAILEFCREIDPTQQPVFISVEPAPGCKAAECFVNLKGRPTQYGWAIWEWPHVVLDAEFHAVHKNPDGSYLDITPKSDG